MGSPERRAWLDERRLAVEQQYDAEAPEYDDELYPTTSHRSFIQRLLETCPPGGTVLDAPCGTGKYFDQVVAAGRQIVGVDQSAGMLARAQARGIATRLEHLGLQEIAFDAEFDGSMTVTRWRTSRPRSGRSCWRTSTGRCAPAATCT